MNFMISVRFLTGYCAAARSKVDLEPEWPPHPARLFMALAAAYFESDQDPGERDALGWLEKLHAPTLYVPETASVNPSVSTFVPTNDRSSMEGGGLIQSLPSVKRDRKARRFPRTHLPDEEDTIQFTWSCATDADVNKHGKFLTSLCGRVGRLGHSMSLVHIWLDAPAASAKPANFIPADAGYEQKMRVVAGTKNTLERLTRMFERPPHRPHISESQGYRRIPDRFPHLSGTTFDPRLEILRLTPKGSSFRSLELTTTLRLTRQLHKAILKNAGELGVIPECISGHKPDESPADAPHLAYIPLPFVGGDFGDGHLMGFAIALPKTFDSDRYAVDALSESLRSLLNNGLTLGPLGDWEVQEDLVPRTAGQTLHPQTWTAFPSGAKVWGTVTPVAFDQHPKSRNNSEYLQESADLIGTMFGRIGLPKPTVRITGVSRFHGVPTAYEFPRLERKDGTERQQVHVVVEFESEVVGPIIIGAGRYRGYGLFKPIPEGDRS